MEGGVPMNGKAANITPFFFEEKRIYYTKKI